MQIGWVINYLDITQYRNVILSGTQQDDPILLKQDSDSKYKDPVYLKKNWRPLTLQCCDKKNTSRMHSTQNLKGFVRYCSS